MQYDIKQEIEQYFVNFWLSTPIQWEGINFEAVDRWISLKYIPITRTANTCHRKFENSQLQVLCYDVNTTQAIKLMDEINTFLDCKELNLCIIGVGKSDGQGVQNLEGNLFEVATIFEVNSIV